VLDAGAAELPVWRRRDLPPGFAVAGPVVIEEQSSSIVIGAGETARVDAGSNLVVEL
jgi:N-methylhydantoinase A